MTAGIPYQTITPYLMVADAEEEMAFLQAALNATHRLKQHRPDGSVGHCEATIGDSVVMIGGTKGRDHAAPAPAHLYLLVDDVDASFRQALDAGATAVPGQEPADKCHGDRMAGIKDPAGNTWWLAKPLAKTA